MAFVLKALGSNGSGQLGIGHEKDVSIPTACLVRASESFDSQPIKIAAGGNHTLVLCESGSIYAAGDNTDGRCGFQTPLQVCNSFQSVRFRDSDGNLIASFKTFAATWEASIFVTLEDEIYVCGKGMKGELGANENLTSSSKPISLKDFPPKGMRVEEIRSCMGHVVVRLSDGNVFGWGNGRKGQLGEPAGFVWAPRRISQIASQVHHIACGRDFTVLAGAPIDSSLQILGADKSGIKYPPRAAIASPWNAIHASWGSVFVSMQNGELVSWGRNDHKQLVPKQLPMIKRFVAGSEHALALTATESRLLAWGWGEHGNCGTSVSTSDDVSNHWNELDSDINIVMIGAGCATSWYCVRSVSV